MPKRKRQETQAEQSARFRKAVREMVAAGELNPTEADSAFDSLLNNAIQPRETKPSPRDES